MNPKSAKKHPPRTPRPMKRTLSSSSESSVSSLHDSVGVYCRLRPLDDETEVSCVKLISPTVLCLSPPSDTKLTKPDIHCTFKYIFTGYSSQREVYDHVALPLITGVLAGRNGLLFTYGVTGSGKTYTLTGEQNNPGVMPRAIYTIFNSITDVQSPKHMIKSDHLNGFELQTEADAEEDRLLEQKQSQRSLKRRPNVPKIPGSIYENDGTKILSINESNLYAVFVSYTEIYNNTVYDLLDESGTITKTLQSKIIREDSNKNMYVNGVCEMEVKSAEEAFELFNLGQKRKRMAQTVLNSESSRSHSIFNIRVVQLERPPEDGVIPERNLMKVAQLSLVDLAGSERTNRTQNTGSRLKEASNINNSLMSLRNCMEILRENQITGSNRLVPYRDSRLTLLFKNYFEGEGRVEMIVCVSPACVDYDENVQVVKFAEMTQEVRVSRPPDTPRFTPYRKRTATTANMETPIPAKKVSTKKPMILFGPKLHEIYISLDEPPGTIRTLTKALNSRKERGAAFSRDVEEKVQLFRKRLLEIQEESVLKKSEITNLKQLHNKERARMASYELKMQDMDVEIESVRGHNEELLEMIRSQRITIDEKDVRLNRTYLEKEKSKQKLVRQAEKISHELDEKLRRQREHHNAEMKTREAKLQQVRAILDDKQPLNVKVSSIDNLPVAIAVTPRPPMMSQMTSCTSMQSARRRPIIGTPASAATTAVRRRRSRSAGDRWLEHDTVRPVALGTVLQPAMKRRKSVTKLTKASDIVHPKQSKYCLIAQEADTDGELETKLYKADIVPTCGGGAQVIFNDVECLRQESPSGTPIR